VKIYTQILDAGREKIRDIYDSLKSPKQLVVRSYYLNWKSNPQNIISDFPTMFRYEMSMKSMIKLYKFKHDFVPAKDEKI